MTMVRDTTENDMSTMSLPDYECYGSKMVVCVYCQRRLTTNGQPPMTYNGNRKGRRQAQRQAPDVDQRRDKHTLVDVQWCTGELKKELALG